MIAIILMGKISFISSLRNKNQLISVLTILSVKYFYKIEKNYWIKMKKAYSLMLFNQCHDKLTKLSRESYLIFMSSQRF